MGAQEPERRLTADEAKTRALELKQQRIDKPALEVLPSLTLSDKAEAHWVEISKAKESLDEAMTTALQRAFLLGEALERAAAELTRGEYMVLCERTGYTAKYLEEIRRLARHRERVERSGARSVHAARKVIVGLSRPGVQVNAEKRDRARELAASGMSRAAIARELSVDPSTVTRYVDDDERDRHRQEAKARYADQHRVAQRVAKRNAEKCQVAIVKMLDTRGPATIAAARANPNRPENALLNKAATKLRQALDLYVEALNDMMGDES